MLGCSLVLGENDMQAWGWRLPFLVAAPLGLVGIYLRTRLEDTPVFRELAEKGETEEQATGAFRDLMVEYWRPILRLAGLVVALNVVNYTLLSYMPTYLEKEIGLSTDSSLVVPIIGMLTMMVFLPFAGRLSDRVGRKPLWWFSLAGLFVAGLPMFMLMGTGMVGAVIGFAVLGLLYVPQLATISATFPAMFPTHVRYAGFAIAYNVSTSLFGGTAPAVNEWLIGRTGDGLIPAYYMMAACVVGAIALISVPETSRCPINGTAVPGTASAPRALSYHARPAAAG
jgi:MHS family proline/betaine transporter-like MFS transporter